MGLADILICLDPSDAAEVRLGLAAAIAREHHARLSAVYVLDDGIGAVPYDGLGIAAPAGAAGIVQGSLVAGIPAPGVPPAAPSGAAAPADIIEQRFRAAIPERGSAGDWHLFDSGEGEGFLALARCFDLVVGGQVSPDYPAAAGFRPADVVLGSGRPLLLVPYAGEFPQVGRRVLVAWDGTREAARALHDALPLIGKAEAVTVITVRARESEFARERPSLERIVRHLEHYGLAARAEEAPQGELPVADVLLSRAADLGADLIIAGGYHHSQLREALLGGVSRDLLDHMTVPVLMSH
jgi:nucleotide-binding universal stress UspA family protein